VALTATVIASVPALAQLSVPPPPIRGFALTIRCEDEEAVVRAHQQLREFDDVAALDSEPERSGWGTASASATLKPTSGALQSSTARTSTTAAGLSTPELQVRRLRSTIRTDARSTEGIG
jgi:hypothetical protein